MGKPQFHTFSQPYLPPRQVFANINGNTRTYVRDFSTYEFGVGQCPLYPTTLSDLPKNKVCQKYRNFIRGDPNWVGGPSDQRKPFQKRWETLTLPNPGIYAQSKILDMLKKARADKVASIVKKLHENIELAPNRRSMILVVN